jgi:hypothetical protein
MDAGKKIKPDSQHVNIVDLDPNLDQYFVKGKSLIGPTQDTSSKTQDQITGVLKHKINKQSKKTKEISLTLNHNNIQQLV